MYTCSTFNGLDISQVDKIDLEHITNRYINLSNYADTIRITGNYKGDRVVFSNAVNKALEFSAKIESTHAEDAIAFLGAVRHVAIFGRLRVNNAITFWDVLEDVEITGVHSRDAHTGIRATQDKPHKGIYIHDNTFSEVGFEGVYIGPSTLSHTKTTQVRIENNNFVRTGWDAIQVGNCLDCVIKGNLIISPARKAEKWQDWAITINPGSRAYLQSNTILFSKQRLQVLDSRCFEF